ncbi:hypothetical protein EMEDMD4_910034 [Sinorhizobium medicae]|uniref:Uncharacterized protein n=1 Tax=Sinorhizobium medicae TaxID=110321 RepID=A0A508XC05_9HYPH|nr:hypothetical protein EMEDMD4_910034 [Sinorhizobium medicae]
MYRVEHSLGDEVDGFLDVWSAEVGVIGGVKAVEFLTTRFAYCGSLEAR